MSATGTLVAPSPRAVPASERRRCFVIGPGSDEGSEARRRSDELLEFIVAPAVVACGCAPPEPADGSGLGGPVTAAVIDLLVHADLVIADLTDADPTVYYELAVRHTLGLPVVPLILAGQRPPFDVAGGGVIEYDHQSLTRTRLTQLELVERIQQTDGDLGTTADNLVRLALSVRAFCERSGAGDSLSAVVLERLNHLERKLDRLAQAGQARRESPAPARVAVEEAPARKRTLARHDALAHFRPPSAAEPRHVSARA